MEYLLFFPKKEIVVPKILNMVDVLYESFTYKEESVSTQPNTVDSSTNESVNKSADESESVNESINCYLDGLSTDEEYRVDPYDSKYYTKNKTVNW